MKEKIFVIAGNYDQFKNFRNKLIAAMVTEDIPCTHNDIVYVDKKNLFGYSNMWGYKVGTWRSRQDIDDIRFLLLTRRSSLDEFIDAEL